MNSKILGKQLLAWFHGHWKWVFIFKSRYLKPSLVNVVLLNTFFRLIPGTRKSEPSLVDIPIRRRCQHCQNFGYLVVVVLVAYWAFLVHWTSKAALLLDIHRTCDQAGHRSNKLVITKIGYCNLDYILHGHLLMTFFC